MIEQQDLESFDCPHAAENSVFPVTSVQPLVCLPERCIHFLIIIIIKKLVIVWKIEEAKLGKEPREKLQLVTR